MRPSGLAPRTSPMQLTARDLMAAGYTRTTAYRILRANRGTAAVVAADAAAPRGPRRVLALVIPDAPQASA